MHPPPFARVFSPLDRRAAAGSGAAQAACADGGGGAGRADAGPGVAGRLRLAQLDPHYYCSILGTCLSSAELRKLLARFQVVEGRSDLDVHHDAVALAAQGGPVTKALNKALDQRHAATLARTARVPGTDLLPWWEAALQGGGIPGAYWALLTHREATPALRQRAFGDVHMLSHLAGAAHRVDLRRLAALETENRELRAELEQQRAVGLQRLAERERELGALQHEGNQLRLRLALAAQPAPAAPQEQALRERAQAAAELVAIQTERRECAEQAAELATAETRRLNESLEDYGHYVQVLQRELTAAEEQLRSLGGDEDPRTSRLGRALQGRRVLYVGGRPSSTPSLRMLVQRHGGEFRHYDGGLEERKGLLAGAVAWADRVVFPVDCIDHDSASNLKRMSQRLGIEFIALRSASVASLAAALAAGAEPAADCPAPEPRSCRKHA
jgi:hypothetical protein